jgi:hypothetical protein
VPPVSPAAAPAAPAPAEETTHIDPMGSASTQGPSESAPSNLRERLRSYLEAMRLKRTPVSVVERAAAEMTAVMCTAALRRERMKLSPDRFPLHTCNVSPPDPAVLSSDIDVACSAIVGVPPKAPPAPPTVPVQTDEDCTTVGPLPEMMAELQRVVESGVGATPLTPVNPAAPLDLPFKPGLEPKWKDIRGWGSALRLEGMSVPQKEDVYKLLRKELSSGALHIVQDGAEVRLVSPIFVVYRVDGKARLVHDLRALNSRLVPAPTKYEDIKHALIHTRSLATKLDLASAFKHMAVSEEASAVMAFQIGGVTFRWTRLPFGMTHSPRMFVAALQPTIDRLRAQGVALSVYVDDILVSASSVAALDAAAVALLRALDRDGWRVAPDKCYPWAHDNIVFLGLRLELRGPRPVVTVPACKALKLQRLVTAGLSGQRIALHALQRITGLMAFFLLAIPTLGLFWRALQGAVAEAERLPGRHVWVRGLLKTELTFLAEEAVKLPFWPNPLVGEAHVEQAVATDASDDGAGAVWWPPGRPAPDLDDWVNGTLPAGHGCSMSALRLPPEYLGTPSAVRELVGLELALLEMYPEPVAPGISPAANLAANSFVPAGGVSGAPGGTGVAAGQRTIRVRWFCDSTAACAGLLKWRSGSVECTAVLKRIADLCYSRRIVITPVWISRSFGWIPAADFLSRELGRKAQAEWSLPPSEFSRLCLQFRVRPRLDLFASRANAMLPRFRSLFPERGSEGDAFAAPWPLGPVYAFPPFSQVDRVLQHWRACSAGSVVLLVAPANHPGLAHALRDGEVSRVARLQCQRLVDSRGQAAPRDLDLPLAAFLLKARR